MNTNRPTHDEDGLPIIYADEISTETPKSLSPQELSDMFSPNPVHPRKDIPSRHTRPDMVIKRAYPLKPQAAYKTPIKAKESVPVP